MLEGTKSTVRGRQVRTSGKQGTKEDSESCTKIEQAEERGNAREKSRESREFIPQEGVNILQPVRPQGYAPTILYTSIVGAYLMSNLVRYSHVIATVTPI